MPGKFELVMFGNPITIGSPDVLVSILRSRFSQFSLDHKVDVIHFARISYRIVVTGTPENMNYLDNMMKAVALYIPRYLYRWGYDLSVNFKESG